MDFLRKLFRGNTPQPQPISQIEREKRRAERARFQPGPEGQKQYEKWKEKTPQQHASDLLKAIRESPDPDEE